MHGEHIHKGVAVFISQLLKRRAKILLIAVEAGGSRIGADAGDCEGWLYTVCGIRKATRSCVSGI